MRPRGKLAFLLTFCVTVLGAASVAFAAQTAPGDGTLAVHGGRGTFVLQPLKGSVIGRLDRGKLTIQDVDVAGTGPIVRGKYSVRVRGSTLVYVGRDIRFRILGGRSSVRIDNSVGVELSVVGRGRAMLMGAGFEELGLSDGEYSLNGDPLMPVPEERTWLTLKAPGKKGPQGP